MKGTVFWDVTSYIPLESYRRFGEIYFLNLRSRIYVKKVKSEQDTGRKTLSLLCLRKAGFDIMSLFAYEIETGFDPHFSWLNLF